MQELSDFEKALVAALLQDECSARPSRPIDLEALGVRNRAMTGSGFITDLCDTSEARAFPADVSLRWGAEFMAVLNATERVGILVYVDHGRITALEAYTFGGNPWPAEINDFSLGRLEDQNTTRVRGLHETSTSRRLHQGDGAPADGAMTINKAGPSEE